MIHVVGLPHTPFDAVNASTCAFTAKTVRFARMLKMIGRDYHIYWGGEDNPEQHPYTACLSRSEQIGFFGPYDQNVLPVVQWDVSLPYWQDFHRNVTNAIRARYMPGDVVALVGGAISQEFVHSFPDCTVIEPGVGYEGIIPWDKVNNRGTFACFESYTWMHNRYGAYYIGDGRSFDAVIPNAVDPNDFECGLSDGYALFVGRLIFRKGPHVAAEIAQRVGLPLKMAGAGVAHNEPGLVVATDGTRVEYEHVEHVGAVTGDARKDLYAKAEVMLVPTLYIGPWEGVHAEALMSGVQVVAPDYGVFTETIDRQFRYRTIGEAVECVERARDYRGFHLREKAIDAFGIDRCAKMYAEWFNRLDLLKGRGFYS